ncbi:MAG TPA: serine/threonine-protein kinase [Myxococcota bacterium]
MRLGNYDIERPLGSGGMSDAFIARSSRGRLVVLKRPRNHDPEIAARMRDEGRIGAKLYHPNLVETIEVFEHEGLPVLVLGFVDGATIDDVRKKAPLLPAAVARIGCQIAEALGTIHGALGDDGTTLTAVHRDVSGRNIVCTKAGESVLIDLGIARFDELRAAHTATGMVLGTLRYMAPELVDGAQATPASDFYSLGCVLIEAATGQPVFTGAPSEIAGAILTRGPLAGPYVERIDVRLLAALKVMCAMKPAERVQESHVLSRALREVEAKLGGGQSLLAERVELVSAVARQPVAVDLPQNFSIAAAPGMGAAAPAALPPASGTEAFLREDALVPLVPLVMRAAPDDVTAHDQARPPTFQPLAMPVLARPLDMHAPRVDVDRARPDRGAPLELAVEPRRKVQTLEPVNDHYPKLKRTGAFTNTAMKIGIAVVVIGALAGAWQWREHGLVNEAKAIADAEQRAKEKLLEKAMKDTADAPNCDQPGYVYVYEDKSGASVIVDRLDKVPKQYRATARCAVPH